MRSLQDSKRCFFQASVELQKRGNYSHPSDNIDSLHYLLRKNIYIPSFDISGTARSACIISDEL